jgi:hypothetical protein
MPGTSTTQRGLTQALDRAGEIVVSTKAPGPSRFAAFLVSILCISPFAVALDLAWHFIPDFPAIQAMRAAGPLAKAAWITLGPLGIATIILLVRRPLWGFIFSVLFAALIFFAGRILWQQLPGGFWVATVACVLAAVGAWLARSNNSFKPNPLRGSA